jgi:hypothetical protein
MRRRQVGSAYEILWVFMIDSESRAQMHAIPLTTTATEWLFFVSKGSFFLKHPLTNVR